MRIWLDADPSSFFFNQQVRVHAGRGKGAEQAISNLDDSSNKRPVPRRHEQDRPSRVFLPSIRWFVSHRICHAICPMAVQMHHGTKLSIRRPSQCGIKGFTETTSVCRREPANH